MKRTVLKFGLISGGISALMMAVTIPFVDKIGFDESEIIGYTTLVVSFLMVFVGIRSYRDNECKGTITFGRAFGVGLLITLVSCICYVAVWEILYFNVDSMGQLMDKYADYAVDRARASGASAETIEKQVREMAEFKQKYQNPLFNAAITFLEPFPVGLIVTLISAGTLRRKRME